MTISYQYIPTKELTDKQKAANELATVRKFHAEQPDNPYWTEYLQRIDPDRFYPKGWESDADALHALLDPDINAMLADHADWLDYQSTRESDRPI